MSYINKEEWNNCRLCGKSIRDLAKIYGGGNVYYTTVFYKHLINEHNLALEAYFTNRPECKCGICKKSCLISKKGSNFRWKKYRCGRNTGVLKWSKEAKVTRLGDKNPMYGKEAWNKGLTKDTNESMMVVSNKLTGLKHSEESKLKQSESAKKRLIHGHTGYKHSEENKNKARIRTLEMIKNGVFKQTKTKPHLKLIDILKSLELKYEEEKRVKCWSFDIYLSQYDIYIEVDGDYYHSNPKIYPYGPKTSTQKVNWYRDIKKNQFCIENNLKLVRFWECDIINHPEMIKEKIEWLLKE